MSRTTKTVIVVAIVGIAIVAYLASRPRSAIVDTSSAASTGPDSTEGAAERAVRGYGAAATELIASSIALAGGGSTS